MLIYTSVSHFGHQHVPETYPGQDPARTSTYQRRHRDVPEQFQRASPLVQYIIALVQSHKKRTRPEPEGFQTSSREVTSAPMQSKYTRAVPERLQFHPEVFQLYQSSPREVVNLQDRVPVMHWRYTSDVEILCFLQKKKGHQRLWIIYYKKLYTAARHYLHL